MAERTFIRIDGIAVRAASPKDADLRAAARSAQEEPGRFNTASFGALYLSCDAETAIAELRRTLTRKGRRLTDADPCSLHFVRLGITSVVDFTRADVRRAWRVTKDDLTSDDMRRCQAIAADALSNGAEAIRWPSAAGSGESLAVFIEHLRPVSVVEVARRADLTCRALVALEQGTPLCEVASL